MTRSRPFAQPAEGPRYLRQLRWWISVVCTLALIGCTTPASKQPAGNDPLFGIGNNTAATPPPAADNSSAAVIPTAPTTPAVPTNLVRDLPPADPKVTTAGLALDSGLSPTVPHLEIGGPAKPLPPPPPGGNYPTTPPITVSAGTTLQPPVLVGGPTTSQPDEWQQGIAQITRRGGIYKLQPAGPGQTTLLCLIPDQRKVNSFQRYEATSAGDPPVAAMRAVLAQIGGDGR